MNDVQRQKHVLGFRWLALAIAGVVISGCAASLTGLFAGIQIADSQRVRAHEVTHRIREGVPDPRVTRLVKEQAFDTWGKSVTAGTAAITLTSPSMEQFVAMYIVTSESDPSTYSGYTVLGEQYRGTWIIKRILDTERRVLDDPEPRVDYGLWVLSRLDYFETRITPRLNPMFWEDSRYFRRIPHDNPPPGYEQFAGQRRFVADGVRQILQDKQQTGANHVSQR